MNTLLFLLSISCPKTIIQNTSKLPWNDHDQSLLNQANKRCGEYYSDAPCVKKFIKYAFQSYSVVCGSSLR